MSVINVNRLCEIKVGRSESTLHMPYVCSVSIALTTRLFTDLFLQPLNLAAQVCDDAGVLGNMVRHIQQISLHLHRERESK